MVSLDQSTLPAFGFLFFFQPSANELINTQQSNTKLKAVKKVAAHILSLMFKPFLTIHQGGGGITADCSEHQFLCAFSKTQGWLLCANVACSLGADFVFWGGESADSESFQECWIKQSGVPAWSSLLRTAATVNDSAWTSPIPLKRSDRGSVKLDKLVINKLPGSVHLTLTRVMKELF